MSLRLLLIDTCGAVGSVALAEGERVVAEAALPGRSSSALLLSELRGLLERAGWGLEQVNGVGVVNGPGSFTGVRVGLAAAKGLCEGLGIRLAAVSRLEVLAGAEQDAIAALDAGRGEVYVREGGRERLVSVEELRALAEGRVVRFAEAALAERLEIPGAGVVELSAASALELVRGRAAEADAEGVLTDANYVRGEAQIYGKKVSAAE